MPTSLGRGYGAHRAVGLVDADAGHEKRAAPGLRSGAFGETVSGVGFGISGDLDAP
jgi:hypothetical protein